MTVLKIEKLKVPALNRNGRINTGNGSVTINNGSGGSAGGGSTVVNAVDKQVLFISGTTITGSDKFKFDYTGNNLLFGINASAAGTNEIVLGNNAGAYGGGAIALGNSSSAIAEGAIAFGGYAYSEGIYGIAIGSGANVWAANSTAIGLGATTYGEYSTAIGAGATANNNNDIEIGCATYCANTSIYGAINFPTIVGVGFVKINAGSLSVDTNSYALSSHTHPLTDTLQSVTSRGNTTTTDIKANSFYGYDAPQGDYWKLSCNDDELLIALASTPNAPKGIWHKGILNFGTTSSDMATGSHTHNLQAVLTAGSTATQAMQATVITASSNFIASPLSTAPTATTGAIYFNSTTRHFFGYDGAAWKQLDN